MKKWMIPLAIFLLALAVRLPGLGGFVTFDESRWLNRSRWFVTGLIFPAQECPPVEWGRQAAATGLACTLQIGYPGVTTMWAGSLGLLIHHWQTTGVSGRDLLTFLQALPIYRLDPAVIPPVRLPLAVAGALFVPCFYGLLRRLFDGRLALVAALLIALHPFHIALSRVLHHDALTATFMTLSVLALAGYWLQGWRWFWLLISAMLGGLALLSKQTSWFLPPFVAAIAALTWLCRLTGPPRRRPGPVAAKLVDEGALWGLLAALTFAALFPAMWVNPLQVMQVIFSASTGLAEAGHTHYFLGKVTQDPGPFLYPIGWLLRATPPEVLGLVAITLATGWQIGQQRPVIKQLRAQPVTVVLVLFVVLFWIFVSIPNKKLVRYYLPAFPIIDIFAAAGLLWLLDRLVILLRDSPTAKIKRYAVPLLVGLILGGQSWLVLSHYPYYLTYHNPLTGSTSGAARIMTLVGWGEGLNEAAAFLNRQPNAETLHVVTERFCSMLRPFFVGQTYCLNSSVGGILQADYLVYYYNVVQRDFQWPAQWRYLSDHYLPRHRVTLHGVDYVSIYRNPIEHPVDRQANRQPNAFTALGYNLSPTGRLTLFWQNQGLNRGQLGVGLAPSRGVYPVGGEVASQQRQWVPCTPDPQFVTELDRPKAIIESHCLLAGANLSPGLYDAQLAVGSGADLTPLESSRLAVLQVNSNGQFERIELVPAAQLVENERVD